MTGNRTGILIIRAWAEGGSPAGLRASIRRTTDVSAGFHDSTSVTDTDAVAEIVRLWLRDFQAGGSPA